MICAHCHTEFEYHRKRKYCSKECCDKANTKPNSIATKKCAYQYCDKEFSGTSYKRFCSNTCRTYHAHGNTTIPGIRTIIKIANAPRCNVFVKTCPITNKLFVSRYKIYGKYHPDAIIPSTHSLTYKPIPKETYTCLNCDIEFQRNKKPDDVLPLCRECSERESRRATRSKRRARIRGVLRDHIIPFRVMLRDNWTCQICGVWTPRELRGTLHDCAPELDHKIPLCKGGLHSYANVHCTCRQCNSDREGGRAIWPHFL